MQPSSCYAKAASPPSIGGASHISMRGLCSGLTDASVGLLSGMRTQHMQKYDGDTDKKAQRAPREDLSSLTAQERVERRKARARVYSHHARQKHKALVQEAQADLAALEIYRTLVERAPHIVMVLSSDLQCRVLYANRAVARLLCIHADKVIGSSLWTLVHSDDHKALGCMVSRIILTRTDTPSHTIVRLRTTFDDYRSFRASLRCGTQGIHCTMWSTEA